jgi:hypothetical protein
LLGGRRRASSLSLTTLLPHNLGSGSRPQIIKNRKSCRTLPVTRTLCCRFGEVRAKWFFGWVRVGVFSVSSGFVSRGPSWCNISGSRGPFRVTRVARKFAIAALSLETCDTTRGYASGRGNLQIYEPTRGITKKHNITRGHIWRGSGTRTRTGTFPMFAPPPPPPLAYKSTSRSTHREEARNCGTSSRY